MAPWPELLVLLGKAGERIMIDLLLDCGVFVAVSAGTGNMWQLSGRFRMSYVSIFTDGLTSSQAFRFPTWSPGNPHLTIEGTISLCEKALLAVKGRRLGPPRISAL